jgi:cytochrome c-type biogenesis protein CcmH/NrfF
MFKQDRLVSTLLTLSFTLSACFLCTEHHVFAEPQKRTAAMIEADASKRVNRLSDELKSPFCPGKTLLNCTSYQAFALRKEMAEMIMAGKTDPEIFNALRESFGEILENPPQPWYTVLVPVMPFILGALIAIWMFSRWLKGGHSEEEQMMDNKHVNSEHQARLQALLRDDD